MLNSFPIIAVASMLGLAVAAGSGLASATHCEAQGAEKRRVGVSLPSEVAEIAAEQSGTIVDMPVVDGATVEKNQVLFRLSSKVQELRVRRLETLSKSNLGLRKARAALDYALHEKDRLSELSDKNIASEKDLQLNELEVVLARLNHEQAELDQTVTSNDLEQAREILAQRTVKSPFAGIVTQILKGRGETSEKLVPVVEVVKLDPLWVEFECPVTDEALFRHGAKVLTSPTARKNESRTGTVVYVSMKANPSSHTFRVRIAVPNKGHTWKAGLKMLIQLPPDVRSKPPK